jgi:DNA repair exonuclease SbcCD ATPase subunit
MTIRIRRWHLAAALVAVVVLLSMTPATQAAEADEDIWSDEPTDILQQPRLSDERFEEFLDRLAEAHPERAEELRKLRKDNPEQFRKEVRQAFAERRRMRGIRDDEPRGQGRGGGRPEPTGPGRMRGGPGPDPEHGTGVGHSGRRERWRERIARRHDEYIEWLEKNFPEEAKKLARLREKDPEDLEPYIQQVMESRDKYGEIMEAQERNPELAEVLKEELELKKDRTELLEKIQTARGKQRKDLIEKLEDVVNSRFDLIVRKKQLRYEYLIRRLERLQKEIKQRKTEVEKLKNKKARFIKERLEELTSKAEKIDWD